MKYFLHDTSAFDDEKVTTLYLKFGYEGIGLFYIALEKMARQEKPIATEALKAQLKIKKRLDRCWKFMEEIGLISSRNGDSFNINLLKFSENYKIKSEKNRKRISEWRGKQKDTKSVTRYEHVRNTCKVKRSKENVCVLHTPDTFYEAELRKTDDVYYRAFVDFLYGRNGYDFRCDYVLGLKDQIDYERFKKLKEVIKVSHKLIHDTVLEMENKKIKTYTSFYLTLNNWLKQKPNVR